MTLRTIVAASAAAVWAACGEGAGVDLTFALSGAVRGEVR